MSYFNNAHHFTINGSTFAGSARMGIDKLEKAVNSHAMHNSSTRYDPPKCHPGTREAILEHIMQWIFGSDDRDALILWLYGPAGAGKSAILQSIADKCTALDILLASFLFSRSDGTRNHPGSLVATIAYQISTRIPQITTALDAAIVRDPMIFNKNLDTQIDALIVGPLKDIIQSGFFADHILSPRLILIDGLDECNNEDQRRAVLRAIARAIRVYNLPLIFLISSRPETDIKFTFASTELVALWNSLVLDDSYKPDDDIRLFLIDSFRLIRETHPMRGRIPSMWPTSSVIDTLVTKSSGQFIYASTVIKYVAAIRASPSQQLEVILGVREARSNDIPFAELDALYTHILSSVQDTPLMLDILALVMEYFQYTGSVRQSLSEISWFFGVPQEDVAIILSSLASITIFLKTEESQSDSPFWKPYFPPADETDIDYGVQLSHASLSDFLSDQQRSGSFHIDKTQYSVRLARIGIARISSAWIGSKYTCPEVKMISIFISFFISPRPSEMPEDLYRDLMSLPLDLIWRGSPTCYPLEDLWEDAFNWLLPEGKFLWGNISTEDELRFQEIAIQYAMYIKPFLRKCLKQKFKMIHFPALAETLTCGFVLNGTRYNEALSNLVKCVDERHPVSQEYFHQQNWPNPMFKVFGLLKMNAGENPYVHAALQIFKALKTSRGSNWGHPHDYHYCHFHRIRWSRPVEDCRRILKSRHPYRQDHVKSGRLCRTQREIHLMKFKSDMRPCSQGPGYYENPVGNWNYWSSELTFRFLIPILDLCPKSDKLLALINRRIRRPSVFLKYTPRRRLMDAAYRYIRRTADVGNN